MQLLTTMEPRFNEVPVDWGNGSLYRGFIISRFFSIYMYYIACSRHSYSGVRAKTKASERAGKNKGRLVEEIVERSSYFQSCWKNGDETSSQKHVLKTILLFHLQSIHIC